MGRKLAAACALIVAASACSSSSHRSAAPTTSTRAATSTTTTSTVVARPTRTTTTTPTTVVPFQPFSATWVSSTTGFVLGGRRCDVNLVCRAALLHTSDRGGSWTSVATPALSVGDQGEAHLAAVRFANTRDGYLFGVDLWSTHDGGAHWTPVKALERCTRIDALEMGTGIVHVVAECGRNGFTIFTGPFTDDRFAPSAVSLPYGAGPVPQVQLVVHRTRAWVIDSDRTLGPAARYVDGRWSTWPDPPCSHSYRQPQLALAVGSDGALVAVCSDWGVPGPAQTMVSADGGATFHPSTRFVPQMLEVGGGNTDRDDVGYTTATQWFVILALPNRGTRAMFVTTDSGATWRRLVFAL